MSFLESIKTRARLLKRDTLAVWYAVKDTRTPWYAKALGVLVTAYAFSPIDLIPDFIPVLGYLDDLVLIPAGIALTIKLIPAEVMAAAREKAQEASQKPVSIIAGILIALVWVTAILLIGRWVYQLILPKN
jgi:uncharacterized membrane protein YkvA (DUF1232 family)